MAEWKKTTLEKCTDILGDGLHGTPKYTEGGEYAFINGNNLVNGEILIKKDTKRVDYSQYEKYKKPLTNRTLLVSINGTLGNVGMYNSEKIILGKSACYFNVKEFVDKDFIYYVVSSPIFRQYLEHSATGTTIKNISLKQMREYDFLLPPIEEQKQISSVLKMIDEKIKNNRRVNENLQQQAFAVFNNLIANAENNDYTVSDYAFLNPKRTLAKKQVARSIDMSQLSTSGSFPSGWEMKSFNGGMRFTNGDTLLARITPCLENGKTAFIDFLDDGEVAFGSTEYIVLTPKNDTPPEMLYCLARYPAFVDYAVKNMNGSSGRQRVSAETVGQYRLPLFDKHSLVLFKEVVAPMFLKMRYNSLENMRLTELRDALLPKLMSGEIDVSTVQL